MTTSTDVTFLTPVTAALAEGDEPAARTITGLGIPFGVASLPDSVSRSRYVFTGPPSNVDELVDVVREHDDNAVVGRLAQAWDPTDDGLPTVARIFRTRDGDDVLELAREGVLAGFSARTEISKFTEAPGGVRHVAGGDYNVTHMGVVRRPAFDSTPGLTVAAASAGGTVTVTAPEAPQVVELPTVAELAAQVAPVVAQLVAELNQGGRHPLAAYPTEAAYLEALFAAEGDDQLRLVAAFAVPDQVTTDNPGVIPPGWRTEIKMNLDARRPAITALGSTGLPPAGMDASWPYLDPALDLKSIIAKQAAEKGDLAGVKIKILKGTEPIETAGTVSDISYQLLTRSSPDYLSAYLEICRAAWAVYTEVVFESELEAVATDDGALPTDAETWRTALFAESAKVRNATGAPASVVGVAADVFITLGGFDFPNPNYGTQNVAGTSSAATLRINVNGLEIEEWPYLTAGTAIFTNDTAAKFPETGPQVATAEDVRKLGRDVAVWGMYERSEVYFPAGVRKLFTAVVPGAADAEPETSTPAKGAKA